MKPASVDAFILVVLDPDHPHRATFECRAEREDVPSTLRSGSIDSKIRLDEKVPREPKSGARETLANGIPAFTASQLSPRIPNGVLGKEIRESDGELIDFVVWLWALSRVARVGQRAVLGFR